MSEKMMRNMIELADSIRRNKPMIEQKLNDAGVDAPEAFIVSMAKYWDAMERLAAE